MRAQTTVLSAFLATILIIVLLFIVFIYFIPLTSTKATSRSIRLDIERTISSRMNWTAKDLVETIIAEYSPEYVNVSIKVYDILDNDVVVYNDNASYVPYGIPISDLQIYRYVITSLARNGYYIEYTIEVGFK